MTDEQTFYYKQTRTFCATLVALVVTIATCSDRQDARFPTRTVQRTDVIQLNGEVK